MTSNLRLSTISASAPAGIANRNMGSVVATRTIETTSGAGSRLVISQPEAALYIQLPTFATTVAIHSTVNVACRNGLQAELGTSATVLPEVPVTRCCRVGRSTIRMRLERPNKRCYVRLLLQSHRLRRNRPPLRRTKAVG